MYFYYVFFKLTYFFAISFSVSEFFLYTLQVGELSGFVVARLRCCLKWMYIPPYPKHSFAPAPFLSQQDFERISRYLSPENDKYFYKPLGDFRWKIVLFSKPFELRPVKSKESFNQGLASGNYDDYKALFEKCYGKLLFFASSILKDKQAAEDIVQEQFMKLWNNRHTINKCTSVESYMYVMTKNASINYIKSHSNMVSITNEEPEDVPLDLERGIDISILENKMLELIDLMPPKRKNVFIMSKIEGVSNKEIASKLGISVKTVDRHLEIAKSYIKNKLSNEISWNHLT